MVLSVIAWRVPVLLASLYIRMHAVIVSIGGYTPRTTYLTMTLRWGGGSRSAGPARLRYSCRCGSRILKDNPRRIFPGGVFQPISGPACRRIMLRRKGKCRAGGLGLAKATTIGRGAARASARICATAAAPGCPAQAKSAGPVSRPGT
jgi:hypothetical protein